jgi:hypothetical protein
MVKPGPLQERVWAAGPALSPVVAFDNFNGGDVLRLVCAQHYSHLVTRPSTLPAAVGVGASSRGGLFIFTTHKETWITLRTAGHSAFINVSDSIGAPSNCACKYRRTALGRPGASDHDRSFAGPLLTPTRAARTRRTKGALHGHP